MNSHLILASLAPQAENAQGDCGRVPQSGHGSLRGGPEPAGSQCSQPGHPHKTQKPRGNFKLLFRPFENCERLSIRDF